MWFFWVGWVELFLAVFDAYTCSIPSAKEAKADIIPFPTFLIEFNRFAGTSGFDPG
jgi:hypothetical protein